ncbi:MAG: hypothetical protein ABR587_16200 [Candidatus Binatia bacterium]
MRRDDIQWILPPEIEARLGHGSFGRQRASAVKSAEMATAQHKLNVLAAVTFPIMALATVLGMNLTNGLEERSPFLFLTVLTIGVLIGRFVRRWVIRRT